MDIKKYSRGAYTSEVEDVPVNAAIIAKKKLAFYEVVLSEGLAPLGDQANCNPSKNILGFRPEKHETKCVDWLVVVKDGNPPSNAKFIGAANGYSVYINDEHRAAHRFSELVLAITEAMLQPSQLGKVGPVAPTIVVAN